MKQYSADEWYALGKSLYDLIDHEINEASQSDFLPQFYPKLVICYEFFRLIRDEGFQTMRGHGLGDKQKELYKFEHDLRQKLETLAQKIDFSDPMALFYLNEMKKYFDPPSPGRV
jgi:hypothetical protein